LRFYFLHILFFFSVCIGTTQLFAQENPLGIEHAILDLRKYGIKEKSITLDGQWEFYWEKFISSADFDTVQQRHWIDVPSRWKGLDWNGKILGGEGYGSYRLRILVDSTSYGRTALRITAASNAYSLFINQKLCGKNGQVGTSSLSSIPQYRSQIYDFEINKDTIDIVFHISNFHYRSGGLWESIELGTFEKLHEKREKLLFFDLLLIGGIFIMGLYHLGIYLQRKDDKSNLYFSILCIAVVLRIMSIGERLLTYFIPTFEWELLVKIEFVSAMIALIVLTYFFHWLFPQDFPKKIVRTILFVESLFALIFLLFNARISSQTVPYHNYITFGILIFNLLGALKAVFRKREGALVLALGFGIGSIFVINDILHNMEIVNTGNTVPFGMLTFFFSQALLLSSRSSKAFKNVLKLSDELTEINHNLELKVAERTIQLKDSNEELKQTIEELHSTLELAKSQKQEIEVQNKNITASINYAKRLQEAMLPLAEQICKTFPQSFILYKPKDIVSGDFYWFSEKGGKQILIVADCTGHGIPGAFMSILGLSIIHQLINLLGINSPELILYELNNGIRTILRQEANKLHEGMDIAICVVDRKNNILEYAGAHRPLYYVQDRIVTEIKGDRLYVGGGQEERIFTKYTVDISKPTSFYLFSDGYQDQYGEDSGKKLGAKFFKEMLFELHQLPAKEQGVILEERFEFWRGKEKQIDDVLVMGVQLKDK
jgi:serine phosphatase RsbU (regulator of sigma subunit)